MTSASEIERDLRPLAPMLVFVLLISLFMVMLPASSAQAATGTYYLKGNGVPKADLSTAAPSSGSLPNYDPGHDSDPGRKLDKSDDGWNENEVNKYQLWVAPNGQMEIDGHVTLTFWSAMKDFNDDKEGRVEAFLLDCTPGGSNCALIDQGSNGSDPWNPSGSWVSKTIDFGSVSYSIAPNRSLALKVVVSDDSDDDMWFAYDTTSYPSSLSVQTIAPTTTTTPNPTTTTTALPTPTVPSETTTTRPPLATTTPPPSGPPSTVAPIVETTSTTIRDVGGSTTTVDISGGPGQGSEPPDDSGPTAVNAGAAQPDGPGILGDSEFADVEDPALAAMGAQEAPNGPSTRSVAWTGSLIEGLELVMPPWAAQVISSPLMVFGFVLEAMTDSGRAIMLPLALLMVGMIWVVFENRVFTLASTRRNDDNEADA